MTDPEPPGRDDPLLAMDNVILTPHVAWYSEESREHVTVEAAREVVRILRGGAAQVARQSRGRAEVCKLTIVAPSMQAVPHEPELPRSDACAPGERWADRGRERRMCASGFLAIGELADGITPVQVPVVIINGREDGPIVYLHAGSHGQETNYAVEMLQRACVPRSIRRGSRAR